MISFTSAWSNNNFYSPYNLCYQENPYIATSCGGLSSGFYANGTMGTGQIGFPYGAPTGGQNVVDGRWEECLSEFDVARCGAGWANYYKYAVIRYTKPANAVGGIWEVNAQFINKTSSQTMNFTIPSDCWNLNQNYVTLVIANILDFSFKRIDITCFNSTSVSMDTGSYSGLKLIQRTDGGTVGGMVSEEAIIFNMSGGANNETMNYVDNFNFYGANFENGIDSPFTQVSIGTTNVWSTNGMYSADYTTDSARMQLHDINTSLYDMLEFDINRSGNPTFFRVGYGINGSTSPVNDMIALQYYDIGNYTADDATHLKFNLSIFNDGEIHTLHIFNNRIVAGYYTYTYIDNVKVYNSKTNITRYFVIPSNTNSIVTNAKVNLQPIAKNLTVIFDDSVMVSSANCTATGTYDCDDNSTARNDSNFATGSRAYVSSGTLSNYTVFENYTVGNVRNNQITYHVKVGVDCDELNTMNSNYSIQVLNQTSGVYSMLYSGFTSGTDELYITVNKNYVSSSLLKMKTFMAKGGACNIPSLYFYEGEVISQDFIYPQNVTGKLNNVFTFLNSPMYSSQVTINNFAQYVNSYRASNCAPLTECVVPIEFRFLDAGLYYSGVTLSNDGFIENNNIFNPITYEGITETFQLNTTIDNASYSVYNATITYNGTTSLVNWNIQGSSVLFTVELSIPNVNSIANNSFYYTITLNNGTALSYHNSATQYQTVLPLEIGNCSQYDDRIFTIGSLVDENTEIIINASDNPIIDIYLKVGSQPNNDAYVEYILITNSVSDINVCMPSALTNVTNFRIDGVLSYETDNHVKEFWYIDNGTVSNNNNLDAYTSNNITLRDLILGDSKTFQFTFYDENYDTKEGGIVTLLRRYIGEGVTKEVERCKLDPNGQCHLHLIEEDVIYQFRITMNGQLIYLSEEYNAKCIETPCTIILQKESDSTTQIDGQYDNLAEGTYRLTSDKNTRTVSLAYNLGTTGTMNLQVYEYTSSNNDPLVDTDSLTAKVGTITSLIPLSFENKTYYAVVKHNNVFVTSQWVDMSETSFPYFGTTGLLMAGILILTLGLISISSGGWTIVFLLVGILSSMATKLMNMDYYLYVYIACAGALIVWKLATRRTI